MWPARGFSREVLRLEPTPIPSQGNVPAGYSLTNWEGLPSFTLGFTPLRLFMLLTGLRQTTLVAYRILRTGPRMP